MTHQVHLKNPTLIALLGLVLILLAGPAAAQQVITGSFTFETVDVPGADSTETSELVNSGRLWGYYENGNSVGGYFLEDGVFTPWNVPGALNTAVTGASVNGQVVGDWEDNNLVRRGFYFDGANYITIEPAGSVITEAIGVNEQGQVVGWYRDTTRHGFLYDDGVLVPIDHPNAGPGGTRASDINQRGDITGFVFDHNGLPQGFLLRMGQYSPVSFPGSLGTFIGGITDDGKSIGGTYFGADFVFHGFIYLVDDDAYVTVDVPGAAETIGVRMAKQGKVIGSYTEPGNPSQRHGFIATPLENY